MRYEREIKELLNSLHIANIFDELPIMLVPVIFEENKDEKLMLGECFLRKLTGIGFEMS